MTRTSGPAFSAWPGTGLFHKPEATSLAGPLLCWEPSPAPGEEGVAGGRGRGDKGRLRVTSLMHRTLGSCSLLTGFHASLPVVAGHAPLLSTPPCSVSPCEVPRPSPNGQTPCPGLSPLLRCPGPPLKTPGTGGSPGMCRPLAPPAGGARHCAHTEPWPKEAALTWRRPQPHLSPLPGPSTQLRGWEGEVEESLAQQRVLWEPPLATHQSSWGELAALHHHFWGPHVTHAAEEGEQGVGTRPRPPPPITGHCCHHRSSSSTTHASSHTAAQSQGHCPARGWPRPPDLAGLMRPPPVLPGCPVSSVLGHS